MEEAKGINDLPLEVMSEIIQKVNDDSGNDVLLCMEVSKAWHAVVTSTVFALMLKKIRRSESPLRDLLWMSTFANLKSFHVESCDFSGCSTTGFWTTAFDSLGANCPHLDTVRFIRVRGVRLSDSDIAALVHHCSNIKTLEITNSICVTTDFELPNLHHLTALESLTLDVAGFWLPNTLSTLTRLHTLVLRNSSTGHSLPPIHSLTSLRTLKLSYWSDLRALPPMRGWALRNLDVHGCRNLNHLDVSGLPELHSLNISGCTQLQTVPGLATRTSLALLPANNCPCNLQALLPRSLHSLHIDVALAVPLDSSRTPQLRDLKLRSPYLGLAFHPLHNIESLTLSLKNMHTLSDFSDRMSNLRKVKLEFSGVQDVSTLVHISSLEVLHLVYCKRLLELPSLDKLVKLQRLDLCCLDGVSHLPALHTLPCLTSLDISVCRSIRELPTLPSSLRSLKVHQTPIAKLPALSALIDLEKLALVECSEIREVPSLSRLSSLQKLRLEKCKAIRKVPSLKGLVSLEEMNFRGCVGWKWLPEMGHLKRLRVLKMCECVCHESLLRLVPPQVRVVKAWCSPSPHFCPDVVTQAPKCGTSCMPLITLPHFTSWLASRMGSKKI